jgi:hypothetical protein
MLYVPLDVVLFVSPVTFVHMPPEYHWSWMVAPEIPVPDVVLSVPLIDKGSFTATVVGLATAESCVAGRPTVTVTTLLVALTMLGGKPA